MNRIALVTGATAGIGRAIATALADEKWDLILTGRRVKQLSEVVKELEQAHPDIRVMGINFDVREKDQVDHYLSGLPESWRDISLLVNNAGLAVGLNPVNEGVLDDWERMIDTNLKGLLYVSKIVSNLMINRGGGHIVNIGSIAGKEVYAKGNVYCASKHAVDALTKGMRIDLLPYNIKVSQICPGAVETEFSQVRFKGDMAKAAEVYKGFQPLKAEDIANALMFIVNLPDHVNINDMVIMPKAQANASTILKDNQ